MYNKNKPFVIGIAGAVGSGKTWFAEKLRESFSEPVCMLSLDCYSKDQDYVDTLEFHYDNPQAIDYDRAYHNLSELVNGNLVKLPIYDYKTHRVISEIVYKNPFLIVVEGLYAFSDKRLLEAMDYKIWVEVDETTRMERRIKRDMNERGDTREDSMSRHINDSEPAYQKFYKGGATKADCIYLNKREKSKPLLINLLKEFLT